MSILDNMNLFGPAAEQLMAQQRAKMDVTRDLAEKHGAKLPYMAAQFAPGMGVQDAAGENPGLPPTGSELVDIFAAPNDPSMRENIQAGGPLNYLMAAGQGLGVLGDAMYAAPLVGVALGPTVGTALKGTGMAVKGAAKGIASLTRPVFPAPQRMFDPANKSFNPSLSDFDYEPGGRYLQMGKDKTDITGQIPQAGKISVGPDGKPSFMVSDDLVDSLPDTGKIIRTNLFKKQAGWKWTKTPEGFDPNPASDFPIVSVETGNKHYYTLATDFPDGVELARYPGKTSEPRLRPTTKGDINLGQQIGEISVRGKKHPVYDQITAGGALSVDDASKLKRAKDMGFRTDQPVYHGTRANKLDEFDDKFIGNRDEGFFGRGHYFTSESGEASYYGPNVSEYFTRGKLLDLSQTTKNSNFEFMDKDYFKFWTKELDKLDMLDEPTQKGLKTINKIDDYVDNNVKFIKASDNRGNDGIAAYVKDPTKTDDLERIYSNFGVADKKTAIKSLKNNIIEKTQYNSSLRKLYPDTDNILYSLSDYIRVGGKGSEELTNQAIKAGYDGIKVGDETVIFDPKNIRSSGAIFDQTKSDSSKLMAGIALPAAAAGAMTMQEEEDRGIGSL